MKKLIKTIDGFNIYFEALEEHLPIDENWSDDEEMRKDTIEKLNTHNLVMFCAKVSAEKEGIKLSEDFLGMCIEENEEDFYKRENCYFDDMVITVLEEAKATIELLTN